jgi:cbb3-type cytochrome c oxidase subunit I
LPAVTEESTFVDFAFPAAPDSAARRFTAASVVWLTVAAGMLLIRALKLVAPGFLGGHRFFSYGRIAPVVYATVVFGWLSLAVMGAMFFVTPRLCGTRLYGERAANLALWVWMAGLIAGIVSVVGGLSTGRETLELPYWASVPLELGFVTATVCVIGTISRRTEKVLYVSLWYFAAAGLFASFIYAVGNAPGWSGINATIASSFFAQNIIGLWVGAAAIGAVYYVVPKVTGNPLYSYRLAAVSFWGLAFLHIWTGQARLVYGPGPSWLQTVAIAFGLTLVVPALAVAVNLAGTMRRRWVLLIDSPAVKFAMAGALLLVIGVVAKGIESLRSVSQAVALTSVGEGTDALLLLGSFSMFLWSLIYYAVPRMWGRQWLSSGAAATHFWLSASGVGIAVIAAWSGGLSEGLTWVAGSVGGSITTSADAFEASINAARPFWVGSLVGVGAFALGQAVFLGHLIGTLVGVRTLRPELQEVHKAAETGSLKLASVDEADGSPSEPVVLSGSPS